MSIRDWPDTERPREKLLQRGAQTLSDAELLAPPHNAAVVIFAQHQPLCCVAGVTTGFGTSCLGVGRRR